MREVIATGKTVEEATEAGCRELGKTRDEVSVEILDMPVRKLFKNIPAKVRVTADEPDAPAVQEQAKPAPAAAKAPPPAAKPQAQPAAAAEKPRQAEKPQPATVLAEEPEIAIDLAANAPARAAAEYLQEIFAAMGAADVKITASRQGDATLLRVEGDEIANVVETRGETIQALSYLTDRAVNKGVDKRDDAYLRIRLDVAGYRNRREGELIALATRTGKEVARTKRSRTLAPMNPYERLIIHTTISGMEGLVSESIGSDAERRVVVKSTAADATDGEDWRPPRSGGGKPRGDRDRGGRSGGSGQNREGGRGGDRGGNRGDRRPGGQGGRGGDRRPGGPGRGEPRSSTPEREYADRPRDPAAKPVVPDRREAIKDGEDLPLYGKIEL